MNTDLLNKVTAKQMTKKIPNVKVGQTVSVNTVIRDGDKTRIQKFTGLVIAIKGVGINKTFTVRKISHGYGVEKIFPFYSPNVESIVILKEEKIRKSKLYFIRDRIGKGALRVRKGRTNLYKNDDVLEEEDTDSSNDEDLRSEEIHEETTSRNGEENSDLNAPEAEGH